MKIRVGTKTVKRWGVETEVELPEDAVVSGVEFFDSHVTVQYWRPSSEKKFKDLLDEFHAS